MRFVSSILCGFFLSCAAFGQVGTATLSGTVNDPTGAVITAAELVLKSSQQQFTRQAVTDNRGDYVIPAVPPGSYELTIRAKGFQDETRTGILLDSGQASTLSVTLNVAGATQQVMVSEAPPLLQTTTATIGTVVETEQIHQLPLLGRNFTSLLLVAPGVSTNPTPRGGPLSATTGCANSAITNPFCRDESPRSTAKDGGTTTIPLDGVENNEPLFNGIPMQPPHGGAYGDEDGVGKLSSGAYGHASGANINLVSKSGSDAIHGDAWEFFRNNVLEARSFFVPTLGAYKFNQFGGTLGGPLVIPKLVSKRNAWYFCLLRRHSDPPGCEYNGARPDGRPDRWGFFRQSDHIQSLLHRYRSRHRETGSSAVSTQSDSRESDQSGR